MLFYLLFPVCVMCVAIRRNIVCAKRSIRTYVQRTTVQHKVTKPHGLYIIMSRTLHTHISPHHMNTHTYTPCCCSTLYESRSIGNWLGSIACWVKDWVGGGEGHTGEWGAGEKEKEYVNAVSQKKHRSSQGTLQHAHSHTHAQRCPFCICACVQCYQISGIDQLIGP